jgi:hypothetical protein
MGSTCESIDLQASRIMLLALRVVVQRWHPEISDTVIGSYQIAPDPAVLTSEEVVRALADFEKPVRCRPRLTKERTMVLECTPLDVSERAALERWLEGMPADLPSPLIAGWRRQGRQGTSVLVKQGGDAAVVSRDGYDAWRKDYDLRELGLSRWGRRSRWSERRRGILAVVSLSRSGPWSFTM